MKRSAPVTQTQPPTSAGAEPALQALIGIEGLKHSARLAGLAGGVLLLLVASVAWLGTAEIHLDAYWLTWAAVPAIAAAFGGPLIGNQLLSRQALTRWRLALVAIMTLNSTAWAFASTVAVSAQPGSSLLLPIAVVALSIAILPSLFWKGGLIAQLTVQLLFTSAPALSPEFDLQTFLLPLGLWASLALVASMAASYAYRLNITKGEVRFMQFESSELQKQLHEANERLQLSQQQRATLENELAEILDLAEDANRAKTEFLATMSHEIRTPLNGILPILEMLRETRLDAEQLKMVRTAQGSSRHLLRIINDILDFAKVESGKLQLETIEIDVRDMVESVTELMVGSARNHNLKLSASVADNVPRVVRGDPIRLRQVLINLVSNAIKFTEEGGIRVEVSRGQTSLKEVELLFAVADTGLGMSADTADRLFQSFTQADASTTRKHGGTGLGLVICKRLVELMGGKIGVRSTLGQGSTFWFLVPLRKSVMEVPSARRDLNGVRILTLVTDDDVSARVVQDLQRWGVSVESCNDAQDALSKLQSTSLLGTSWSYELVLIDGNGLEPRLPGLLAEIRGIERLKQIHIVVAVRSEKLGARLKRDYGALMLTDALRPEPLRRLLYRLFDVESRHFGTVDMRMDEVYDDLNVSVGEFALDDASTERVERQFDGAVLLVEDNPVNLGVVKKALSRLGLGCVSAADGEEALEQFRRQRYDLVFMDCQMPVMDGYEATRQIRRMETQQGAERTPIIAMTANAMTGDREKCLAAGMDDYLAKPVGLDQLRTCISGWLGGRGRIAANSSAQPSAATGKESKPATVLDDKVLHELKEIMEDDYVGLLRTYLRNAPELLAELEAAAKRGDVEAMIRPVHSLKSSSANVGAVHLSALARDVEQHARARDFGAAKQSLADLYAAFADAEEALRAHVASASAA